MQPITILPFDFQQSWRAHIAPADQAGVGAYRLVKIERTQPGSGYEQRITVAVIDEDERPLPGKKIAFAYSTGPEAIYVTDDFKWIPRIGEWKAFFAVTGGGGEIDQIQGSSVKDGHPGGVTVFVFEPEYPSDIISGCGMLADHTGMHLTFQLQREGVLPVRETVADLAERLEAAETRLSTLEAAVFGQVGESSLFKK